MISCCYPESGFQISLSTLKVVYEVQDGSGDIIIEIFEIGGAGTMLTRHFRDNVSGGNVERGIRKVTSSIFLNI